ncbi:MAG: sigma-70 family RNA polymerase sigma factor [Candidatus Andersenbacteria bacterium]
MDERQEFDMRTRENWGRIYRAIGRYISDACTIEDLTQNTFMRAWVARETFRGESSYSTWLYKIAINTALNFIAEQKRRPQRACYGLTDVENLPYLWTTEEAAITKQEMDILSAAINRMPDKLKTVMVLQVLYGLSYEQIAECVDIPIGTVRSRLNWGKYLLKDLLKE